MFQLLNNSRTLAEIHALFITNNLVNSRQNSDKILT